MRNICFILMLSLGTGILIEVSAQSKAIYTNPKFDQIALHHKKLAVIPFDVTLDLRPKEREQLTKEEIAELEISEGEGVQNALHAYFLKKKASDNYRVDFQDPKRSNTLIEKQGLDPHDLGGLTTEEIAAILEVDGVISGTLNTSKPMSEGASAALGVLFGVWGPTNAGKISISINNGADGVLLWKYDKTLSRSLGSDFNTIINAMMRKASRKFPYREL